MATVNWTKATFNGQGDLYSATLSTGDETDVVKFLNAEDNVQVSASGTVAGSTVTVQTTLDGTNFVTAEGQAGTALALTTIGIAKLIKTPGIGVKVAVSAGTAADLAIDLYVPKKVRP